MNDDLREILEQACGVERAGPYARPGSTLADWQTFKPGKQLSITQFRHRMLLVLQALPEDMTVAQLREELEPDD